MKTILDIQKRLLALGDSVGPAGAAGDGGFDRMPAGAQTGRFRVARGDDPQRAVNGKTLPLIRGRIGWQTALTPSISHRSRGM